jgi:LPXTG-site transpeptidase (sortase) family protein
MTVRAKIPEWLEPATWCLGLTALLYCGLFYARAEYAQLKGAWELQKPGTFQQRTPRHGDLIGRIEIPSLDLSGIVFEGSDDATLARGVGHVVNSVLPGEQGNLVLAAHRDSFFRPLEQLKTGSRIVVSSRLRTATYRVNTIRIVDPTSVYVMRSSRVPIVTLITCYPFTYIGNAPKRYVVQGTLESSAPAGIAALAQR